MDEDQLFDIEVEEAMKVAWLQYQRQHLTEGVPDEITVDPRIIEQFGMLVFCYGFQYGAQWNNERMLKIADELANKYKEDQNDPPTS